MSVKITYLGHASFLLSSGGVSVLVDPYADGAVPGLGNIREKAAAVFCSHGHDDHNFIDAAEITGEENPFSVTEIATFHDDHLGALRGPNIIRIFEADGIRIAHFGDLGHELSEKQISELSDLDVLLIPVGGHFTIDAAQAAEIIGQLKPVLTIPMHYRTATSGYGVIGTLEDFEAVVGELPKAHSISIEVPSDEAKGIIVLDQKYM